ncbi:MAG: phosphoribosylglycinamide formyltransferase [Abditibacteriota bacterium]|nr:phosphoribosylglycinamide formyltransferase [Abditibacteriota bacterium]
MTNIAILVSGAGRGSNMKNIIEACKDNYVKGKVQVVIGIKESPAILIAKEFGVKTLLINPKDYACDLDYQNAIYDCIKENNIDLICLAGYMKLLGGKVLSEYENRIMNVHPALIPMFYGKGMFGHHIHEAAIKRGVKVSGCTVHFVDKNYDTGPIILQTVVYVEPEDTPDTLAARILPNEHKTYREAVRLFCEGKLSVKDGIVKIID